MAKKKSKEFLSEFIKNRKQVGSVTPSSRFLVKKMLAPVDFEKGRVFLEFGPGEGVITHEIVNRMHPDARLFSFEMNAKFCETLRADVTDERVQIIEGSATLARNLMTENGIEKVDAIISSLPLKVIPKEVVTELIHMTEDILRPGGVYVQYQYTLDAWKRLKGQFSEVKLDFTPLNVPPAFVYKCVKG